MNYSTIKKIYFHISFHLNPSRTEISNMQRKQGGKGMTASTVWELQRVFSGIKTMLWINFGLAHVPYAQRLAKI